MLNNYHLEPVWADLLEIYSHFANLCSKNSLRHWLAYGSVLGAVRHNGFIPWDDDLDVFMPREDYEKFLQLADHLPKGFQIVNWKNSPELDMLITKVVDTRQDVVNRVEQACGFSLAQGLFIDIFPLDGIDDNRVRYWWHTHVVGMFFRHRWSLLRNERKSSVLKTIISGIIGRVGRAVFPSFKTLEDMMAYSEKYAKRFKFGSTKECGEYHPPYCKFSQRALTSSFASTELHSFCGNQVPIPGDFNSYLAMRYGDWRRLPPTEKRRPAHANMAVAPWRFGPTTRRSFS